MGNNICGMRKKTSIGGQALIEGIMMRGPKKTAMAVRNTKGEIVLEKWDTENKPVAKILRWPIIRGVRALATSFSIGYKCLTRSAEISGLDELENEQNKEKTAVQKNQIDITAPEVFTTASVNDFTDNTISEESENKDTEKPDPEKNAQEKKTNGFLTAAVAIGSVLGVVLSIVLFMWLPALLFKWFAILADIGEGIKGYSVIRSAFEGIIKIVIFVSYMSAVSMIPDIKRTFMYHGAEHKTIFCYEAGLPLTVDNIRTQSRFHPRCGTSFMIFMLLIGIFIGIFIPVSNTLLRTAIRLILLPLVVGLGYELIKYAGRHDNVIVKIISAPGIWMQHISTKNPDDSMIECAIAAMNEVIPQDGSDNW